MNSKIDHNLPVEVAELLRHAGHNARTAAEQGMAAADDMTLAEHCRDEARCIVTLDMGFSDIRSYPPVEHPGIIVLRPRLHDRASVLSMARAFAKLLEAEPVATRLWIVEPDRIRIHGG